MRQIKFSHRYEKLGEIKNHSKVVLMQVINFPHDLLSDSFIEYDTMYLDEDINEHHYNLPKTDLLILIFMADNGGLFTTIRRFTPDKFAYYKSLENEELELVITSEDGEQ